MNSPRRHGGHGDDASLRRPPPDGALRQQACRATRGVQSSAVQTACPTGHLHALRASVVPLNRRRDETVTSHMPSRRRLLEGALAGATAAALPAALFPIPSAFAEPP